jgi:hypothetical protein
MNQYVAKALIGVGILVVGGALAVSYLRQPVVETLAEEGLGESADKVGTADAKLTDKVVETLGFRSKPEPEIDLRNPKEADIVFLLETFRGGEPRARASAARALVEISEPRAVGLLLRATGTAAEVEFFCAGAFEILRQQTRDSAATLMLDVIEDREHGANQACLAELGQRFEQIGGITAEQLPELLQHSSVRVRRYGLAHLPTESTPETRAAVETLSRDLDGQSAELARAWLVRAASQSTGTPTP